MAEPKADRDMMIILRASKRMAERLKKKGVEVKFNMSFGPIKKAKRGSQGKDEYRG